LIAALGKTPGKKATAGLPRSERKITHLLE